MKTFPEFTQTTKQQPKKQEIIFTGAKTSNSYNRNNQNTQKSISEQIALQLNKKYGN